MAVHFLVLPVTRLALPALMALLSVAAPARAADIVVLTAGAFKPVLLDLAQSFRDRTGETLAISNDTAGGVTARVMRGEEADLVILPAAALDSIAAQGKVAADSVAPVAKSGIGVVVKKGVPAPDISSVDAFRQTLLDATSIAYIDPGSGGSSGIYLAKMFDKLGIGEAVRAKAVLVPGGLAASRVDDGEAALALQQISELHAVSGVTYVGALPDALQSYTVYAGGVPSTARRPAAGKALLAYLRSEAGVKALTARGLEQP
jgi:molybdate transport system substrate-binding protein